jgi:hypothetical protein
LSDQTAQRRPDHLTHQVTCHILACNFDLRTNSEEVFESFRYIVQRSEQDFPVSRHHHYSVTHDERGYLLVEDGTVLTQELARFIILENLSKRMHQHAFEALPAYSRIHAASGFAGDRFFIVCGEKYAGKSTLSLRLLYEGFQMVGDELVMLHKTKAVTFPRKMYIRHDCVDLVPAFQSLADSLPFVSNAHDDKIFAFDPLLISRPWRIRPAPIATFIYIEPNHGGRSRLRSCGKLEMVQRILMQANAPITPSPNWIGEITSAIDMADTYILELGDLESAVLDLKRRLL